MNHLAFRARALLVPVVVLSCSGKVVIVDGTGTTGAGLGAGGSVGRSASTAASSFASGSGAGGGGAGGDVGGGGGSACSSELACGSNLDCPPLSTVCLWWACIYGCCSTFDTEPGTACADSGGKVCDGGGHCVACVSATDCPATTATCKVSTCTASNTCAVADAPPGAACSESDGGVVCDGDGHCVP